METSLPFYPMLADSPIELLVFLLIAGISALVNWLQKKKQGEMDWSEVETPPGQPKPTPQPGGSPPPRQKPRKKLNWEEELRRMLEGDDEEEERPRPRPAKPVLSAPPVIREAKPVTRPPATQPSAPALPPVPSKVQGLPRTYKAHCENCGVHIEFASNMVGETIICPQCHHQTTLHPFGDTKVEETRHRKELSSFKDSASAFQRAASFSELAAARLHTHGPAAVAARNVSTQPHRSPEVEKVVSLLRTPHSARQAIIASVILGQPKALEDRA